MLDITHIRFLLAITSIALLSGCSSVRVSTIRVIDDLGHPVAGAKVYSISLSMNMGPNITNNKGETTTPSNIQGTKWISIECEGYKPVTIDAPSKYPITVRLNKPLPLEKP